MSMRPDPESISPGSARTYAVELLYEQAPRLSATSLLASIGLRCPDVERPGPDDGPLRFFHTNHCVDFPDGSVPVQTFVSLNEGFDPSTLAPSVKQSWKWRKARQVVPLCRASVIVSDMLAFSLPPPQRLNLFQRVLDGVIEAAPCIAIHWVNSQQLIDPAAFREMMARCEYANPLVGAVNVRLFQIAGYGLSPIPGGTGDSLMDTMGLTAFGLLDLQCHFRGLEHDEVAKTLSNTAYHVFQRGTVLESGHTVPGCPGEAKWLCRVEQALQPPDRSVIDLDPGQPYSAGKR
jgi:hypothetical protein